MALKIRLRQHGRKNRLFYRVVVADVRSPRDGKYVECVGWYNPFEDEQEKKLHLKEDRIEHWLNNGVQLSEKAEALVARGAPAALKAHKEKQAAHRVKVAAKRREARQKSQ
jgi:small subunit ribosomal protein S16